jgi:hypothetical protein
MQIDPSKEVTITVAAGALMTALAALAKQPYEQVAQPIAMIEQALSKAFSPEVPVKAE